MSGSGFTKTKNLGLIKPNFNQDKGAWGDHLNFNWDTIDELISSLPFLPLAGGSVKGPVSFASTITQNLNTTWSGAYPGTGNVGLYSVQNYTGSTPATAYSSGVGGLVPLNLIELHDTLGVTAPAGTIMGLEINYLAGGVGASGSRGALDVNLVVSGPITTAAGLGTAFVGGRFQASATANVGGTAGTPAGDFFGLAVYVAANAGGTFINSLTAAEFDFSPVSGAVYQRSSAMKLVNYAPAGMAAQVAGSDGGFQISSAGGSARWRDWALLFGDPQTNADLPVGASGTLIKSMSGAAVTGIDMSASTFVNFLKGPHGFYVANSNAVGTDEIAAVSSNSVAISTITGNPIVTVNSDTISPPSSLVLSSLASGNVSFDATGTNVGLSIGTVNLAKITLGKAGGALGFYGTTPIPQQTGVAVTINAVHAALVTLGLIAP